MRNYKKFSIKWFAIIATLIIAIMLPLTLVLDKKQAETVTIIFIVADLVIGLFSWAHFRIELNQIMKHKKKIFSNEDIEFYCLDPKDNDVQKATRVKKITVFIAFISALLLVIILTGIHTLI